MGILGRASLNRRSGSAAAPAKNSAISRMEFWQRERALVCPAKSLGHSLGRGSRRGSLKTGAVAIRAPQARKPAPDARLGQMKTRERQSACKPGSVWLRDRSRNVTAIPLGRASLRASSNQPGRPGPETGPSPLARAASSLFGFAPGGACRAVPVAGSAVRSYRTFSPLPAAEAAGGSISVALSLGSPPPDVIRHRVSVEPGLSSPKETEFSGSGRPADWRGGHARWGRPRQARPARKRPKAQLRAVIVRTLAQ